MSEEKKCCCKKGVMFVLILNTVLLAAILFKLCCYSSKGSFCPYSGKKGSMTQQDLQQKGSPAQPQQ